MFGGTRGFCPIPVTVTNVTTNPCHLSSFTGYILSRESLRRFVEEGIWNPETNMCNVLRSAHEDVQLGRCLESVGVRAMNSTDGEGKHRFLPLEPGFFLDAKNADNQKFWLWKYLVEPMTLVSSQQLLCSNAALYE